MTSRLTHNLTPASNTEVPTLDPSWHSNTCYRLHTFFSHDSSMHLGAGDLPSLTLASSQEPQGCKYREQANSMLHTDNRCWTLRTWQKISVTNGISASHSLSPLSIFPRDRVYNFTNNKDLREGISRFAFGGCPGNRQCLSTVHSQGLRRLRILQGAPTSSSHGQKHFKEQVKHRVQYHRLIHSTSI